MTPEDIAEMQEACLKWQGRLLSIEELEELHGLKTASRNDLRADGWTEKHITSLTKEMILPSNLPETIVPIDPDVMYWQDKGQWYKRIREGESYNGIVYTGMDWFRKINKPFEAEYEIIRKGT